MKPLKILCIIASLLLLSCTPQTTVEEVPNHQPKYPSTWSPAGKVYVSENTQDGNGYFGVRAVWHFITADSVERWETDADDIFDTSLSPCYERFVYEIKYPKLYYDFATILVGRSSWFEFSDTCSFDWSGYRMKLRD